MLYKSFELRGRDQRRGIALLVVIALLTLFATLALTFVNYAESQASASVIGTEAQSQTQPESDPELLLSYFLEQLLFDTNNLSSAMRGHSLGRTMCGYNPFGLNHAAYSGIGRLHYPQTMPVLSGLDDWCFPNYQNYNDPNAAFQEGLRDPEFYGHRANPSVALVPQSYRAGNAPYTYPDHNNYFLAQVDADGYVITPSFRRKWMEQLAANEIFNKLPPAIQPLAYKYSRLDPDVNYHKNFAVPDADLGGHVRNLDLSRGFKVLGQATKIAAASNGQKLPQPTIFVASTAGAPPAGFVAINTAPGVLDIVAYTGITPTSFTGCTGGSGTMLTDVSALPYAPAGNDSVWLDLGYPVMIAPNGKKYKALFAPLIIDLDNRINLFVSGNAKGPPANAGDPIGSHLSNRGYGPSEIRLASAGRTNIPMSAPINNLVGNLNELKWLYNYRKPLGVPPNWPVQDGPFYGRIDFDAVNGGPLQLPGFAPSYISPFPSCLSWYGTGTTELVNHPLGYNYLADSTSVPAKSVLDASHAEALLRYLGTGAPAATSDLFRNMPSTFANPRSRGLLTTMSATLDRIAAAPYIADDYTATPNRFGAANFAYGQPGKLYPVLATALTSPSFVGNAPTNSEFTPEYRSKLVNRLRLNLNRISSSTYDYPVPNGGLIDTTVGAIATQFNIAQAARQQLARDIYNLLILATGAQNPNPPFDPNGVANPNPVGPGLLVTSTQYQAARWLAQLAANIVDYIDNDDYMTPYNWDRTSNVWVYGTETPRLVLNEAFAQFDNDPANVTANVGQMATTYNLNVWAELHNPLGPLPTTIGKASHGQVIPPVTTIDVASTAGFPTTGGVLAINVGGPLTLVSYSAIAGNTFIGCKLITGGGTLATGQTVVLNEPYPIDSNVARLNVGAGPAAAYQLVLCRAAAAVPDVTLRDPSNVLGDPSPASPAFPTATNGVVNTWGGTAVTSQVLPANGAFNGPLTGNTGFFVVGPNSMFLAAGTYNNIAVTTRDPGFPTTYTTGQMVYTVPAAGNDGPPPNVTILLRRLACPYLPFSANTNPYITIDYIENVPTVDNRVVLSNGNAIQTPAENTYSTVGRKQPYAALRLLAQTNVVPNQPQNTFFQHNTPLTAPFNWLTHLDRPAVNAMELLHVSGFRPHELTQQFMTYPGNVETPYTHIAPWTDEQAMIFRALEMVGVPSYLNGTTNGGRVPGKININTMNELEIWQALCDWNSYSAFSAADLNVIYQRLIQSRTLAGLGGAPGPNDVPFKGFATGWVSNPPVDTQYPSGSGRRDTLLRDGLKDPTQPFNPVTNPPVQLFSYPTASGHPYKQTELLQKVHNNITSTSNVFAVWLTVGFFEVDDAFTPPKIGVEIGRDQGRHVRHKMFSIVDRTQLTLFTSTSTAQVNPGTVQLASVMPANGITVNQGAWALQDGMLLEFGSAGNSEVVAVRRDNNGNLVADFTGIWPMPTPITCRGNPGPWTNVTPAGTPILFNPREHPRIVPHYSVIQ